MKKRKETKGRSVEPIICIDLFDDQQKKKKKMAVAGLCDDLIVEIFTRLPPKSLVRFKSLNKWWCRRICSPDFIRRHTLVCSPQKSFLFMHELFQPGESKTLYTIHSEDGLPLIVKKTDGIPIRISFKFPYPESAQIIASCNGILCISERGNNTPIITQNNTTPLISLWNPSIRHKLTLPPLPSTQSWFVCNGVAAGFGFGFDPKSDDYKIIWIDTFGSGKRPKSAFVYALKTGAWCEIAYPASPFTRFWSRGCFLNGALHWLVDFHIPTTKVKKRYVMTLDLSTHVFGTIALPEPNCAARLLTTIKGSLAVISGEPKKRWICWVRGKNHTDNTNAFWYVVYKTKTDPFSDIAKVFELTTNDGNFLLGTHYACHQVYNFETGVSSGLQRLSARCATVDIEQCVETLELLDRGTAYVENQPSQWRKREIQI
uniref:F-box/kelch-repeat protein At3g06240-like n=1 Tax=Erigeron canadensis TaxID=72917 RepID=UPI001CB8BA68|nr:F-box/kelch-repeat protein At3g06240-like [Erigeron canadensis]